MSDKITGVQAITKDEPSRIRTSLGTARLGVGLERAPDGEFWLWMGDGTRTLGVKMTADEVAKFAIAIGLFPSADFGGE
jgi:hypothetical protein